jgi:hypothetical protein
MGIANSKNNSETIDWNNIKTENISSSVPNFNGLSSDAKKLIASLNIPSITESEASEMNLNHILDKINNGLSIDDQQKFNQLLEQVSATESEGLSNTSPFISSEMYDYLVNSKTSETDQAKQTKQTGGYKKSNKLSKSSKSSKPNKSTKSKKGGALSDDSSDTSSTSSDSSLEDLIDSTEQEILDARNKKKTDKKHKKSDSDSEMSGGNLSYLSSSAHTEGAFSDSSFNGRRSKSSASSDSVESSSQTASSVSNENHGMLNTSVSVNTEDINMVSDY